MERGTKRHRGGDREVVEEDKGLAERQWGEGEELALVAVWDEVGAQHVAESRAAFELISERLRRLSVVRSWRECQAKCKSLGLQGRKPDVAAATAAAANYSQGAEPRPVEGWEEEVEGAGKHRGIYPSSVTVSMQEGVNTQLVPAAIYGTNMAEEGGRHWTDDEVRALLCVWADQHVRERLKSTLRNKSIFQEMARQMQRNFGVVRNWKQCRTKYKNLKYDYKTAKSAHAAGGSAAGGPGRYMKFFEEVEAILLDQGLENGTKEMQKRLYNGEVGAGKMQTVTGHTGALTASENEVIIEIDDDDNSDEYDIDGDEAKWRSPDAHPMHADSSSSDQFHVVTVSDTGRNWSDQEVRALIQVWSDKHVCRQLESSTRKRDIFVQISNSLKQQGIERDWKQCHTKYKNLKYLYRSLQRGKMEEADPRRLMRFYDEVDAIMNRMANGSLDGMGPDDSRDLGRLLALEGCEENNNHVDGFLTKMDAALVGAAERTRGSHLVSLATHNATIKTEEKRLPPIRGHHLDQQHKLISTSETRIEKEETSSANRGMKRKAPDQDTIIHTPFKKHNTDQQLCAKMDIHCKEEQDHIPIIKINSVCSMASTDLSTEREVISVNPM